MFDDSFAVLDGRRLYLPTIDEIAMTLKDFTVGEIFTLVGFVLWCVLLAMPLSGVDRRDGVTGTMYLWFMAFAAAALVMAMPGKFDALTDGIWQLVTLGVFAGIAAIKWTRRRAAPLAVKTTEHTDEPSPGAKAGKGDAA